MAAKPISDPVNFVSMTKTSQFSLLVLSSLNIRVLLSLNIFVMLSECRIAILQLPNVHRIIAKHCKVDKKIHVKMLPILYCTFQGTGSLEYLFDLMFDMIARVKAPVLAADMLEYLV
jgi:hypothetical protein